MIKSIVLRAHFSYVIISFSSTNILFKWIYGVESRHRLQLMAVCVTFVPVYWSYLTRRRRRRRRRNWIKSQRVVIHHRADVSYIIPLHYIYTHKMCACIYFNRFCFNGCSPTFFFYKRPPCNITSAIGSNNKKIDIYTHIIRKGVPFPTFFCWK